MEGLVSLVWEKVTAYSLYYKEGMKVLFKKQKTKTKNKPPNGFLMVENCMYAAGNSGKYIFIYVY